MEVWGATAGEKVPRRVKGLCNDWEGLPENSVDWETERERDRKGRKKMKVREKYSLKGKKMRKWQKLACVHECMFGFGVQFRNKLVQSVKKKKAMCTFYTSTVKIIQKCLKEYCDIWNLRCFCPIYSEQIPPTGKLLLQPASPTLAILQKFITNLPDTNMAVTQTKQIPKIIDHTNEIN